MRWDEVKARLNALESRVDILEGKPEKVKPIPKPAPVKVKQEPQIGTTTNPFGSPLTGQKAMPKKPKKDVTTSDNISKPVEVKPKPQIGTTTEPFNQESKGAPKVTAKTKATTTTAETKATSEEEDLNLLDALEAEKKAQESLDIDPLDKHLNDEMLEKKYGDRTEEAKKLLANEK